jgi:N-acyl-D-amino-acid deacylase
VRFDLLVRGGSVVDGTGAPPRRADVGILGDRIDAVGDLQGADAAREIDASGALVTPGFIDVHSHSDTYILLEPTAPSKLTQGITTEICGNCGASAAPRFGEGRMPSDWSMHSYPGSWSTVGEYREVLASCGPSLNIALLAGHNTLRGSVLGYGRRAPSAAESGAMRAALDRALEEGALGLSTGLLYAPGLYATREELLDLARSVARAGGILTSHMRNETDGLLEALDEILSLGRDAGCRVQISHLKAGKKSAWRLAAPAVEAIDRARRGGVEAAADRYPYCAGSTDLDVVLPAWAAEGTREAILYRLKDPAAREQIERELAADDPGRWDDVRIGSAREKSDETLRGVSIAEAAERAGCAPERLITMLLRRNELHVGALFFGMSEENMRMILRQDFTMAGSDASIRAPRGPLSQDFPHPRAYGTMPRFLRLLCADEGLSVASVIRRMTALPAEHFRLGKRGRIEPGWAADVICFHWHDFRDRADYAHPHRHSEGIRVSIVNGRVVLEDGLPTGEPAGRFLARDDS